MPSRRPTEESLDTTLLLRILTALRKGDFSVCLPLDGTGGGKIAAVLNDLIEVQGMSRAVVVFTTSAQPHDTDVCYQLGANSSMVKPVDFEPFRHALELLMWHWFSVATLPERRSSC